jgi:hypothetical protein
MACARERFLLQIDVRRKKRVSERLNDAFCAIFGVNKKATLGSTREGAKPRMEKEP